MKPKSNIEDDYLAGVLSVDTYVAYRAAVINMFERRANKLSRRLMTIEILGFIIQSSGAVLAIFEYTEWVALTVAIAAVLQGLIEFMNIRDQLTSVNIALKDLEAAIVYWDSLSIVRRRTNVVKMQLASVLDLDEQSNRHALRARARCSLSPARCKSFPQCLFCVYRRRRAHCSPS